MPGMARYRDSERGMALMIVLIVMMLLSALMIGFMTSIMADQRSSGIDRDETQTYAAAHAGMEKLTSELAAVFRGDYSPNGKQISDVATTPPSIPGFKYLDPADPWSTTGSTGYRVQFTTLVGGGPATTLVLTPQAATVFPAPDDPTTGTTIAAGPYQGFKGLVTHYNIIVTARSSGGSEVRMRRELQTVAGPVFQFGVFSEGSLAFHSASDFNFGGRVHTNDNLFLAAGSSHQLWLGDKVTAVGEVVRRYLDNGLSSLASYPGTVNMATGAGKYRVLSATTNAAKVANVGEGSVKDTWITSGNWAVPTAPTTAEQNESTWTQVSVGGYNGYIRNGRTGARKLDLPLVSDGAQPIDLIKRPKPGEDTQDPAVGRGKYIYPQRYYKQASLRILLSDTKADITGLPDATPGDPISLENALLYGPVGKQTPLATSVGTGNYLSSVNTPLIGGWINIDIQKADGTWQDATTAVLAYGISGKNISNGVADKPFRKNGDADSTLLATTRTVLNGCLQNEIQPNAIIRLQRVKDIPTVNAVATNFNCATDKVTLAPSVNPFDYWPNALFDAREGLLRDESGANTAGRIILGGVMYYVELDAYNLGQWFLGKTGFADGVGTLANNDNNGYIVYFSDRRNNRTTTSMPANSLPTTAANAETGEYGNEDAINPKAQTGLPANNKLDPGEDVNVYVPLPSQPAYVPVLDTYGTAPSYQGTSNQDPPGAALPLKKTANPNTDYTTTPAVVRGNRPIFFRRALKIVNGGSAGMLSLAGSGAGKLTGLTIASENPVYVQGDYNDYNNASSPHVAVDPHVATAIIADAVTLLSNNWNDISSFSPDPVAVANKAATDTFYRFATVTGKNISFNQNGVGWSTPEANFGMDGGAHNLLRQLEDWKTPAATITYRGSIVSFYFSRQATGIFKCCNDTYSPGERNYTFDDDFLIPSKLPPGTPMIPDVNTLTFRQLLRPNQ